MTDLSIGFAAGDAADEAPEALVLRGMSFAVRRGELVALVGESGSGKSLTALAILGLLPSGARVVGGSIELAGAGDVLQLDERRRQRLRGRRVGIVFQDAMTALNPVLSIGRQITESLRLHRGLSQRTAHAEARRLLELVAMPDPERRLRSFPHELSGGQRQRALLAVALASGPDLLVADEPTTALDVTVQAQVLDLLADLRRRLGLTVLLITHDLAVVAEHCDRVAVLHDGRIVEQAPTAELFRRPRHPYTHSLLAAVPRLGKADAAPPCPAPAQHETGQHERPLVELAGVSKSFRWHTSFAGWRAAQRLWALSDVDLEVRAGECLALVGESGSGKTTLARCMVLLHDPDRGTVRFAGEDLRALPAAALRRRRRDLQMVFQSSAAAFDPRQRVAAILAEPLRLHRVVPQSEIPARVARLLRTVGLAESFAARYPHQLSGGQQQRLGIARALATEPRLLILDEPVSALDVPVREQILRLLRGLQKRLELTTVFIAHDLSMVEQIADRVAVLYLGRLVELGPRRAVFSAPQHPYTASLLAAVPLLEPGRREQLRPLVGEIPSALTPPPGCVFHPRCPLARRLAEPDRRRCREEAPALRATGEGHSAACHFSDEVAGGVK